MNLPKDQYVVCCTLKSASLTWEFPLLINSRRSAAEVGIEPVWANLFSPHPACFAFILADATDLFIRKEPRRMAPVITAV